MVEIRSQHALVQSGIARPACLADQPLTYAGLLYGENAVRFISVITWQFTLSHSIITRGMRYRIV
jgi:hypothetical protein